MVIMTISSTHWSWADHFSNKNVLRPNCTSTMNILRLFSVTNGLVYLLLSTFDATQRVGIDTVRLPVMVCLSSSRVVCVCIKVSYTRGGGGWRKKNNRTRTFVRVLLCILFRLSNDLLISYNIFCLAYITFSTEISKYLPIYAPNAHFRHGYKKVCFARNIIRKWIIVSHAVISLSHRISWKIRITMSSYNIRR